ncbi:hypothetical protein TRIP_C60224 [Candidatus Zixiibacteriota bacterium]|nr:hypothetical protein TRIP_C60224 [candidate division Zixibacteria bacterium]
MIQIKKIIGLTALFALSISASRGQGIQIDTLIPRDYLPKLRAIKTIHQVGHATMLGMSGKVEMWFAAPDRMTVSFDLGILKMIQGYDGGRAWIKDQNNQVMELTGNERKKVVNSVYLAGESYLVKDRMPGTVAYLKDTLISSQKYAIFSALPDGGDSIRIFLNRNSGRVDIAEEKMDEISIFTYSTDYRIIDGYPVAFDSRTESTLPQLNSVIKLDSVQFNVPVERAIFGAVADTTIDYFFPPDIDSVVVPMKYDKGHIFITARVAGEDSVYFVLDSGAGINIIDKTFAETHGIKFEGDIAAKGVAGYQSAAITEVDSIKLGEIVLLNQKEAVTDVASIGLVAPGTLGGVMGYDLASRFPFLVDYAGEKVIFYNPRRFHRPDSSLAIPFEFIMKIPAVTAEIDGYKGKFLIDLGNAFGLIIHKSFADKYNLEKGFTDIRDMNKAIGGVGGVSSAKAAVGESLLVGPVKIEKPPLLLAEGDSGILRSTEIDGNIGNLMLQQFSVLFDYSEKTVYFMPARR